MPKLRIISVVVIASLALAAGVAMAANTQTITQASGTPLGKGTAAKPVPKTLKMTFEIKNADDPTQRPVQTQRFSLAAEGVVDFAKGFPKCKFSQALLQSLAAVKRACGKARVGGGLARNLAGAADNTSIADSLRCNLGMNFYNLGDGAALRLDGDPPAPPAGSDAPQCAISIHTSIRVRYVPIKVDGVSSTALRFTVPDNLLEPVSGVLNSVVGATFTITSKTRSVKIRGKSQKVKIGSAIGCKGRTRTAIVDFTDVTGNTQRAEKEVPC
jgi:hypothetical protein